MDILDNVATELGFEFHLYIVRDELFGAKYRNFKDWIHSSAANSKEKKNNAHKSQQHQNQQQHQTQQYPNHQYQQETFGKNEAKGNDAKQ